MKQSETTGATGADGIDSLKQMQIKNSGGEDNKGYRNRAITITCYAREVPKNFQRRYVTAEEENRWLFMM